jgi:hypothetical protein
MKKSLYPGQAFFSQNCLPRAFSKRFPKNHLETTGPRQHHQSKIKSTENVYGAVPPGFPPSRTDTSLNFSQD